MSQSYKWKMIFLLAELSVLRYVRDENNRVTHLDQELTMDFTFR
jgi:hypothetical protein